MASLSEDLLVTVNKLQDLVFSTIGIDSLDLPQIVVVGSQSAGKSSVLENIVGRDFLPRGNEIVTRRPLILQLINIPGNQPDSLQSNPKNTGNESPLPSDHSEWGEFFHQQGRRYYDFSEIRNEIDRETTRIAGHNRGISRQPINLKIYSPHVLNLTLVDLPGLTKVPIGDQPADIEKQTRNLIKEYISKPNSIILAVSPANVDLVNSEALKLARFVDPQCRRTIGVLTKIDLMDQGTNALDILSGRVYPLRLGFVGVVNRSQQDIISNKPLHESLASESDFFRNHPAYRHIANRCGTQYLAKTLNMTLLSHIRERLPNIKARLNTLMGQAQQELSSYGDSSFSGKQHDGTLLLQLMTKFAISFISAIDGTANEITKEFCGGARIYYIFNTVYGNSLKTIDPNVNLTITDIRTAIRNSTGPRASLFVPEMAFDLLVKPQIRLLEVPSQRCVELVYEELIKICHKCGSTELGRYPRLQDRLIEVVCDLLRERLEPCLSYVSSMIDIQQSYINTNHSNFLGAAEAMTLVTREMKTKIKGKSGQQIGGCEAIAVGAMGKVNGKDTNLSEGNFNETESIMPKRVGESIGQRDETGEELERMNGRGLIVDEVTTNGEGCDRGVLKQEGSMKACNDGFLNYFFSQGGNGKAGRWGGPCERVLELGTSNLGALNGIPMIEPGMEMNEKVTFGEIDVQQLSEREYLEIELIRKLISSYFNVVRESVADMVPKTIMHFMVNHSKAEVQNRLVSRLYKEELFGELLLENESVKSKREKCEKLLKTYREAAKIVSEV